MFQCIFLLSFAISQNPIQLNNGLVLMSDIKFADSDGDKEHSRALLMDVAFPAKSKMLLPAVIFVHGGGWSSGKRQDGLKAINMLAMGGYFTATIDYRLSKEQGFPAAVHDSKAAIKFLRSNAHVLGIDPERIGIVGYSAGGHIAALVGFSTGDQFMDGLINGNDVPTDVVCIGSISGALMPQFAKGDGKKIYEEWALQESDVTLSQSLPHLYLDPSDPPIYLLCGEDDQVCPVEWTHSFVDKLKQYSISYEIEIVSNQGHQISSPNSYMGLLAFLDEHLGGHAKSSFSDFLKKTKKSGNDRN